MAFRRLMSAGQLQPRSATSILLRMGQSRKFGYMSRGLRRIYLAKPVNERKFLLYKYDQGWSKRFFNSSSMRFNKQTDQEKENITKEKLLSEASNSFKRFLIHIKWPLTRNNRPLSADDFSAFVSWLVMGNLLWVILGTTTFGLVIMYSIHTFDNIRDTIKSYKGDENEEESKKDDSILGSITSSILSHGLGVRLVFQKGNILPELKDGMLRFRNFTVHSIDNEKEERSFKFSAKVESMNISLSFNKWYEGNGLIHEMEIYGMNGKIFKNNDEVMTTTTSANQDDYNSLPLSYGRYNENIHFQYDMNDHDLEELRSIRQKQLNKSSFIDSNYELEHVKIHDSYFEIFNESEKKPLKITIFNCELPKLTGNKLLIDFFNANNVTGSINNSMFTIHKRQEFNKITNNDNKIVRFKLDGINMGSISQAQSKFNWIVDGKAEIIADIRLPNADSNEDHEFKLGNEYKRISNVYSELFSELINVTSPNEASNVNEQEDSGNKNLLKGALAAIYETFTNPDSKVDNKNVDSLSEYVIVNVKVKFYNLKASLPKQLPVASSTLIPFVSLHNLRSLIAFVNNYNSESKPPIIVKTTVIEKLSHLYNIENLSQTKIFDSIISDIYEELLKMVKMDEKRIINEKSSMWSHSVASQLLLLGLGVIV